MDGGKTGNHKKLLSWIKAKAITKKVHLFYEFESMKQRKTQCRGVASINQNEMLLISSVAPLRLPEINFTHCPGSNKGSGVGPIKVQPYNECWCLRFEQKKELYGKMRLPVGGTVEEDGEESSGEDDEEEDAPPEVVGLLEESSNGTQKKGEKRERGDKNIEPVTYHSVPPTLFHDFIKCYGVENIFDMSPLDGELCITAVEQKKNYLGVCFNQAHCDFLERRVRDQIFERMADTKSDLYNADYIKFKAGLPRKDNEDIKPPTGDIKPPKDKKKPSTSLCARGARSSSPASRSLTGRTSGTISPFVSRASMSRGARQMCEPRP